MITIDLTDPKQARKYCEEFKVPGMGRVDYVKVSSGETIYFNKMSDERAVEVAHMLHDMELEMELRSATKVNEIM